MIQSQPTDPQAFAHRLEITSSARTAWRLILEHAPRGGRSSILLPAYIGITDREGSGVFDPVEQAATPHAFYPLDDRLGPDGDAIEAMLATGTYFLLLVIHYFGIVRADMQQLRTACRRHGVVLVEDCAHVPVHWIGPHGLGGVGDASFYSLHKSLPIGAGGALRINDRSWPDIAVPEADRASADIAHALPQFDFPAIAARRRENYTWLAQRLAAISGIAVLYPDIGDAVPLNLPVLVEHGRREKLYFALREAGIGAVALYYRLIDDISRELFPASHALSGAILNLPIHQELGRGDLERMLQRVDQSLREMRGS